MKPQPLPPETYLPHAVEVARALLGQVLVRQLPDGTRLAGRIVETEAYTGHDDLASHGRVKKTPRNLPMWEAPGRAYVYLCRGTMWLINIVVEPAEQPAAVLIRALEPTEGLDQIAERRTGRTAKEWTSGPARLTQALAITDAHNRADVTTTEAGLWLEAGTPIPNAEVVTGARIGLGKRVSEPWFSIPWRFCVKGNPYVSKPLPPSERKTKP